MPGTLVATNTLADVSRMNLNVQFWFWRWILDKGLRYVKRNLSACGVHSKHAYRPRPSSRHNGLCFDPLSMIPCTTNVSIKKELPSLTLAELTRDPSVTPKQDSILIAWESRYLFILLQAMLRAHMKVVPSQGGSEEECQSNFV